jgi:hypothetical protein
MSMIHPKRKEETAMRMILMALALGISTSAIASPALADQGDDKVDRGIDKIFAQPDRETPQINVSIVAGTDEPQRPAWLQQRYENQEGQ